MLGRLQRYFSRNDSEVVPSGDSHGEISDEENDEFEDLSRKEPTRFGFGFRDRTYTPISTQDSLNQHGLSLDHASPPMVLSLDRGNSGSFSYQTQNSSDGGEFQGFGAGQRKDSNDWGSDWKDNSSWEDNTSSVPAKDKQPKKSTGKKFSSGANANQDNLLIDLDSEKSGKAKKSAKTAPKDDDWGEKWGNDDEDAWESLNEK